jgi:NADPH:quinone reductase
MRAIQLQEFGGPDVLELVELPAPEPEPGEVLIKVSRAGLNFADTHTRTNSYLAPAQLPLIPGGEVVGVRQDTGARVLALTGSGGYAEYATAREELTFDLPDAIDDGTALALIVQGTTAWHLYRTSAQLRPGETVVVHAAAGGVGSLAVQLGKPMGAGRVIATASTEDKRRLALELGADVAIDAAAEGMSDRLIEANGGQRVDVVFEMAGGEIFEQSRKALAPFGRVVAYGIASQKPNELTTGSLLRRSHAIVGFWLFHCFERPGMFEHALSDLFERVKHDELRIVVGATYALGDARQAHIDLQERRTKGKLLLDPRA